MNIHYQHAIDLMDNMLLTMDSRDNSNEEWDELFEYMFKHFPSPITSITGLPVDDVWVFRNPIKADYGREEEVEYIHAFFKQDINLSRLTEASPRMFPIVMAKFLLFNFWQELNIHTTQLTTFDEFYYRYGYMISKEHKISKNEYF